MNLSFLLGLRAARRRLGTTLGVGLGIAAGVAGLEAMRLGTAGALAESRAVYEDQAGDAALVLRPATGDQGLLPPDAAAVVAADPDIAGALPLVSCRALRMNSAWKGMFLPTGQGDLSLMGVDFPREGGRWTLVEGAPGEGVLVGEAWARSEGLKVGDKLTFRARQAAQVRVDGLLAWQGLGARGYGRAIIGDLDAVRGWCGYPEGALSELALSLRPGASPAVVAARVSAAVGAVAAPPATRGADVEQRLRNLTAGTDLLGFVGLFLSAVLIWGLVSSRAAEQGRTFGLLRAAGASRAQAAGSLLVEVLVAALPGAILGALLGWPLARGVALVMGEASRADLRLSRADPAEATFAAIFGVVTALVAAAVPAIRAANQPVMEALRTRVRASERPRRSVALAALLVSGGALLALLALPPSESPRWFTLLRVILALLGGTLGLPAAIAALAGPMGRAVGRQIGPAAGLALAGLRWRPSRSGMAAGAVLGAVALVGGVAALGAGVRAEMADWSARALGWDVYASAIAGFGEEDRAEISAMPGVARVGLASIRSVPLTLPGREEPVWLSLVGIEPQSWEEEGLLRLTKGDPGAVSGLADGQTALVTGVVAAQLGLGPGDVVEAPSPEGTLRLRVSGEVVDYTENGFALVVDRALLARAYGAERPEMMALRLAPGASVEALTEALAARPGVVAESQASLRARVLELVDRSLGSMDRLLWLAGVVGLLAVGAAVSQGARERRADVATLSAIGMTRRQVLVMVVAEGLATSAIGAAPGVAFGLVFGLVFTRATHTLGIPAPFVPPWSALLGAAGVSILCGGLAAYWPARSLSRVSGAAALRADQS